MMEEITSLVSSLLRNDALVVPHRSQYRGQCHSGGERENEIDNKHFQRMAIKFSIKKRKKQKRFIDSTSCVIATTLCWSKLLSFLDF